MNDAVSANLREISNEEMINFLIEHNISAACPACDHPNSGVQTNPDGNVTMIALPHSRLAPDKKSVNVEVGLVSLSIFTQCHSCGFHRIFSYKKVMEWLDRSKA